jgi:copper(I)-binding protein
MTIAIPRPLRIALLGGGIAATLSIAAGDSVAAATEICRGDICVSDPWARATPKDAQSAAIYFSILNKGRTADALVSASSSATANAMVHRSVLTGNIVRMEMPGVVELAPGAHLTFAPVGYHVMLEALKQPLTEGSTISLTLNFAKAGKVTLAIPVLGVGAAGLKSSSK